MENFDHKKYRDNLAAELWREKIKKKRQRILRRAQTTNEYGVAKQAHFEELGAELSPEREAIYESLAEKIGNTPLVQYGGEVPNGNKIFMKLECENPYGNNHYDRVYLKLFYEKEKLRLISPGDNVFETSSGSAGVSFAAIGRELGYKCHVAIPAGGEKAREQATADQGAEIYLTPEEDYVNGFKNFIIRFMREHPDYIFLNHSMGNILGKGSGINESSISAMEDVAEESFEQLKEYGVNKYDYLLSAVGNGTNTLGVGRKMKEITPDTRFVGYETMSSGVAFQLKNPGQYEERLDVNKNGKVKPENFSRHSVPGTSFPGIDFPALNKSIELLDEIVLVADKKTIEEYKELSGTDNDPEGVVHWDNTEVAQSIPGFGRSTRAGVSVALNLAKEAQDKTFLVIAYDKADRYDNR